MDIDLDKNELKEDNININYNYELRQSLVTKNEQQYLKVIKECLTEGYFVQPQINLASIIKKTNNSRFQNELFRNIDACIFDLEYKPLVLIEINDISHNSKRRIERDTKVKNICEEAGIPLVRFWTKYGVNKEYINKKIYESLECSKNPVRIKHSNDDITKHKTNSITEPKNNKQGCYIATCVYGSYNCENVWLLRRFRDFYLKSNCFGKVFIKLYYNISPKLVKRFGKNSLFNKISKCLLDKLITYLKARGYSSSKYFDN